MFSGPSLRRLSVALVVCVAALWAGGALTRPELAGWYAGLAKPAFTPPGQVFAVVWPVLFLMMAAAWWRASLAADGFWSIRRMRLASGLFLLQIVLNVGWSALFFRLHAVDWAFVEIVVLLLAVAATTRAFWGLSRAAGLLLLPYLAWVGFAVVLNLRIWQLNQVVP